MKNYFWQFSHFIRGKEKAVLTSHLPLEVPELGWPGPSDGCAWPFGCSTVHLPSFSYLFAPVRWISLPVLTQLNRNIISLKRSGCVQGRNAGHRRDCSVISAILWSRRWLRQVNYEKPGFIMYCAYCPCARTSVCVAVQWELGNYLAECWPSWILLPFFWQIRFLMWLPAWLYKRQSQCMERRQQDQTIRSAVSWDYLIFLATCASDGLSWLQCNRAVVTSKRSFYSIGSSPIRDVIGYCFCCGTWLLLCLLRVIVWPVKLDRRRQRIASWLTVLLLCFLSCTSTQSQNHADWRKLLGITTTTSSSKQVILEQAAEGLVPWTSECLWRCLNLSGHACSTCWPLEARDRRMGFA